MPATISNHGDWKLAVKGDTVELTATSPSVGTKQADDLGTLLAHAASSIAGRDLAVDVRKCRSVSLAALSPVVGRAKSLSLSQHSWLAPHAFEAITAMGLEELELFGNGEDALDLGTLAATPTIKMVTINRSRLIFDDQAATGGGTCSHLEILRMRVCDVDDSCIAFFTRLRQLLSFEIAGCRFASTLFTTVLPAFDALRNLALQATNVTPDDLEAVSRAEHLRFLDISDTQLNHAVLDHLPSSLGGFNAWRTPIGDELSALTRLPRLALCGLGATLVSNAGMRLLSKMGRLNRLFLNRTSVDSDGIGQLDGQLPLLRTLSLWRTRIDDRALAMVSRLPSIEALHLGYTAITDAGIAQILSRTTLSTLTLHRTGVTTRCLSLLSQLPNLKQLYFDGTDIGPEGLPAIAAMPMLRVVGIADTRISPSQIAALRPDLSIDTGDYYRALNDEPLGSARLPGGASVG